MIKSTDMDSFGGYSHDERHTMVMARQNESNLVICSTCHLKPAQFYFVLVNRHYACNQCGYCMEYKENDSMTICSIECESLRCPSLSYTSWGMDLEFVANNDCDTCGNRVLECGRYIGGRIKGNRESFINEINQRVNDPRINISDQELYPDNWQQFARAGRAEELDIELSLLGLARPIHHKLCSRYINGSRNKYDRDARSVARRIAEIHYLFQYHRNALKYERDCGNRQCIVTVEKKREIQYPLQWPWMRKTDNIRGRVALIYPVLN